MQEMETVASEINAYTLIEKEIIASLSFKDTHAKNQDPDLLKKLKS